MEVRVRTKSDQWIWILDRGKVFARDEHGQPVRMVGTELDITARKRIEEALRLAEARSSGIVSISADAIISIDEDQRITLFNEGAEKIFGYAKADVIGAPLDLLIPERLHADHRQHVAAFAAGEAISRRMGGRGMAIYGRRKNGAEFPAEAAISMLAVGGQRIFTVALRDVTERKRLEEELRAAVQSRDDVLSVVAHDLRSPLSTIMIQSHALGRGQESERAKKWAASIERAARRMNRLIQDLLDVTRMEAGGLALGRGKVRPAPVVSEAVDAHRPLASSESIELQLDLARDLPEVLADRDRLAQVFENLIGNALKFTEAGGRITVGAAPRDGEVLFWVADTGRASPSRTCPTCSIGSGSSTRANVAVPGSGCIS
jgi:PAS domain S-box-containing protein